MCTQDCSATFINSSETISFGGLLFWISMSLSVVKNSFFCLYRFFPFPFLEELFFLEFGELPVLYFFSLFLISWTIFFFSSIFSFFFWSALMLYLTISSSIYRLAKCCASKSFLSLFRICLCLFLLSFNQSTYSVVFCLFTILKSNRLC